MAARPNLMLQNTTIETRVVKSGSVIAEGVGVKLDADEVDLCAAGNKCYGVAMSSVTGDGVLTVQVAVHGGIVKVKCSGTATQGEPAICGTDGFENQVLGGGTVVKHLIGHFDQTGVDGDYVGVRLSPFTSVGA